MIKLINRKYLNIISLSYHSSSSYRSQLANNEEKDQLSTSKDKFQQSIKSKHKPIVNTAFMKNLFVGNYDTGMLVFPEALTKKEIEDINEKYSQLKSIIENSKNEENIDSLIDLKSSGIYGLRIPEKYGGLELKASDICKLSELSYLKSKELQYITTIHSIVSQCILIFGNDLQKEKYLPKLATGEITAAICIAEPNAGSDLAMIETKAYFLEDEKEYLINGQKIWVTNGNKADIFIVFAKTLIKQRNQLEGKLSAFIVDGDSLGIERQQSHQLNSNQSVDLCTVIFNDVKIPLENLISEEDVGYQIAFQILNSNLFSVGSASASILKNITGDLVKHCIDRKQFDRPLKDFGLIQNRLARISINIYVMESMSYLAAGVIDSYQNPDILIECVATKVLSTMLLKQSLSDAMEIFGSNSLQSPLIDHLVQAHSNFFYLTTDDILKLFISLSCLEFAGNCLKEDVMKYRNPLHNITYVWRQGIKSFKNDRKILSLKLYNHVHPDLSHCGEALELRLQTLQMLVSKYWATFGTEEMRAQGRGLEDQQFSLQKFADIAIDIFAATACMARATRSKAIGLKNNDHEILIARTYAFDAIKRIDSLLADLDTGSFQNGDFNMIKMSELIIKNSNYAAVHPLSRNW